MHSSIAVVFALPLLVDPLFAQTGRSVELNVSPTLGAVSSYTARYPVAAAGRIGAYGMTLPFASAVPLALPGITSNGLVRIDLANILVQGVWLLDNTGSFNWTVPVPNAPVFQGLSFDVQTLDVDLAVTDFAWGDNELSLTIGPATIAVAPNMLWIPAGTFQMGSPVTPLNVAPYFNLPLSQPVRAVTITRPFWIGKYEVTQAEFRAVMGNRFFTTPGPQQPATDLSWYEAMAYCAALTTSETAAGRVPPGYLYRLPSEAEWEYCYRAGTTDEYWMGPTLECSQARFRLSYHTNTTCGNTSSAEVGSYPANPWGLHDVVGNVAEWCLDFTYFFPHPPGPVSDPYQSVGWYTIRRGGSYASSSYYCRAAAIDGDYGTDMLSGLGFRIVLAPPLP